MDTSGESHIDIVHNIYKRRLDLEGKPIEDPQREQGLGETKKIINATKPASIEQVLNFNLGSICHQYSRDNKYITQLAHMIRRNSTVMCMYKYTSR